MTTFTPADAAEAAQVIAGAAAEAQPLGIVAGGSKRALGRPVETEHELDLSRLTGIIDYDPAELVLTAHAATPMAELATQLASKRQMLAFEPPDWRGLLGSGGEPTLGGVVATNLAGPRRIRTGAARDHLLGFSAINGWGDLWKSGGRVVKNVTGYDMCKLQAGAYGTLSVLTELSVRVLPLPETFATVVLHGLTNADAIAAMARAMNAPQEVSAAAHLPEATARRAGLPSAATLLRLEGPEPSVQFRARALEAMFGEADRLDDAATHTLWRQVGEVSALLHTIGRIVWRVCPTPSEAAKLAAAITAKLPAADVFYDWGGGLVWLSLDPAQAGEDAGASIVRSAVRAAGGHATLVVAPDATRARVPVFEPLAAPLDALSQRVKNSFDPRGVLNPGRVQEGR